jgi:outer membrane protein assembly factor BamD
MTKHLFPILLVFSLLVSCKFDKILKSGDYAFKYRKAKEYYEKKDFVKAGTLYEQMESVYKGTVKADTIEYFLAKCYYEQKDYILAGNAFKTLVDEYTNSPFAEESYYMEAYCYYMQSPRPSLDQESTYLAIDAFRLFMIKYPKSTRNEECKKLIIELNDKLVEKAYLSAKLYYDMGNYKASIIALNNNLTQFPDTKYREELMYMILKSKYLLADNSVPSKRKDRFQLAVDEYYSFTSEFPNSKYQREVLKMYEDSQKYIKN